MLNFKEYNTYLLSPTLLCTICGNIILATRDTQFGQEVALVMQTTHAQRMRSADSIPIVTTSVCFLSLKMYTGITKILEFEYKTGMF